MKLDSIIYDANTLSTALQGKLIEESPSFKQVFPSEASTALTNLLGGYGSMLQYTIVSALANCYTDTAFSPTAIYQLAETLGNKLHGNVSSQLYCDIERTNLIGVPGVVIPANSVFEVEGVPFFNYHPISFGLNTNKVKDVLLVQGEYTTVEGFVNGIAGEKFYFSNDFRCNMNMVKVFINGEEWSTRETFLPLNAENLLNAEEGKTVVLRMDPSGRAYVKFGNNSNGNLPISGSTIKVEYVSNIGSKGNIDKSNMDIKLVDSLYFTNNAVETLLKINAQTNNVSYGGYDVQSVEMLKETSPYVFASGNRAVRRNDYKAILLNKCGYISANVWGEYEEAKSNGGYDKIMMNMVYYTGIKEIQQYDMKQIGALEIKDSASLVSASNPAFFTGTLGNIRGFPGSYEIDLVYDIDVQQKIRFTDKNGNGILVCDPSDNNYKYDLYPYNDGKDMWDNHINNIMIKTITPCEGGTTGGVQDAVKNLMSDDSSELRSTGKYNTGAPMKMSYDEPFQIQITFTTATAISMVAFKTPVNEVDMKYFPGKIAIYATDETDTTDETLTHNIKNNSLWHRIAEVQTVNVEESVSTWSDWITTNLFDPADSSRMVDHGWKKYKRYMIEIYYLHEQEATIWEAPVVIQQMKFMIDSVEKENGLVDHSVSTVDYEHNSTVNLCVPAVASSAPTLPEINMDYYKYSYSVSGLTLSNGYRTGDILAYAFDNGMYANVLVTNINNGQYRVCISNVAGHFDDEEVIQKGKRQLKIQDAELSYISEVQGGSGAKITIDSDPAITVLGSFTGNAYNTATAQMIDSPIIEQYNHFTTYTEFKQPRVKPVRVDVSVEYENSSTYKEVRSRVITAIQDVFRITPYYVGKGLNVADLWKAINEVAGVKRFIVNYPIENIDCEPYEFITLPNTNLTITDKFSEDFK